MEPSSTLPTRIKVLALLAATLWSVETLNWMLGGKLIAYGIRPREWSGLWGIPLMPFLHAGWHHLAANFVPLLVLAWLILLRGIKPFIRISVDIVLWGGLGTWLIGKPHTVHVGASGLILGYVGCLILRGLLDLSLLSILSALVVVFFYGGLIWAVLPTQPAVSWEAHLCGFLAGLICAWRLAPPRRPAWRRRWRRAS